MLINTRSTVINTKASRCRCGERLSGPARFCPRCGDIVDGVACSVVSGESRALIRRILAEIVDRVVPLPFLAFIFPPWTLAVVAYHLICDGTPSGRSIGKWIFRLRVISITSQEPCGIWRASLRRLPTALGQAAYCGWVLAPVVLAIELASLAFVWLNPSGRRVEDYAAGTQVVTEGQYQKLRPVCSGCGLRATASAVYCPHCGTRRPLGAAP